MTSITDNYIDSLYNFAQTEFPERVIMQAKKCLLDYLGVTFAGSVFLKKKGNIFLDNSDNGNIPVIGFNRKSNLFSAVLMNGMSSNFLDLDDGVRQGNFHPGASIISALLPITQKYKLNGNDLLRGIIVGYEASIRLASAIQPSHRNKGYHATGTCGTIGASLGIGAALGFSKLLLKNTLSAAATSSSGMLNVIKGTSELKSYNAGQAAVSALHAAFIAQAGFNGPFEVLTGKWGFIDMMADKYELSFLERKSDSVFEIEKIYMKCYASCRHCHPAIEASLRLKQQHSIKVDLISKVLVTTYSLAVDGRDHTEINSTADAKFSIPYSVAIALITGRAGIEEYSKEMINNDQIRRLAKKVKVISDGSLDAFVPQKRPAIVTIITHNQEQFICQVNLAKGEPENPFSTDEIVSKFLSLSLVGGKSVNQANQIVDSVWNIEAKFLDILNIL